MTSHEFQIDLLARALTTLPWASIGLDDKNGAPCATVAKLVAIVRKPEVTDADLAYFDEVMRREISTHEVCDNFRKAECLETYLMKIRESLVTRMKVATEDSDTVLVRNKNGLVLMEVTVETARAMGVLK